MDLIMILFRSWTLGPLGRLPHVAMTKNPPRRPSDWESNKKNGFQMCAVLHLLLLRLFFLHLLEIVLLCWEILRDSSLPGWENCECMIATENHPSIWTPSKHVVKEILLPRGNIPHVQWVGFQKTAFKTAKQMKTTSFLLELMAVPTVQQSCCICIPAAILARASSSAWAVAKSWIFALKVKDVSSIEKIFGSASAAGCNPNAEHIVINQIPSLDFSTLRYKFWLPFPDLHGGAPMMAECVGVGWSTKLLQWRSESENLSHKPGKIWNLISKYRQIRLFQRTFGIWIFSKQCFLVINVGCWMYPPHFGIALWYGLRCYSDTCSYLPTGSHLCDCVFR